MNIKISLQIEKAQWTNFSCKFKMIYPKLFYSRVIQIMEQDFIFKKCSFHLERFKPQMTMFFNWRPTPLE